MKKNLIKENKMIKLGSKVRDTMTGLEGIAVVRAIWLWGCVRIGLQPYEIRDGKPVEESWFDESRLEVIKEKTAKKNFKEKTAKKNLGEEEEFFYQTRG
jgi:hypothetical protein